jgi:hypothetical protein
MCSSSWGSEARWNQVWALGADKVRMSGDMWTERAEATGSHDLPARPDVVPSLGPAQAPAATSKQAPGKLARVGGAVMGILGGLLMFAGFSELSKPEYTNKTGLYLVILLCAASVVGGRHLYKKGWQQGHDLANVMSVLPAAVLVVLITFGAIAQGTRHKPPTDAYGYTVAERQAVVSGCGGGARCECLFSAMERSVPHDQFVAEAQRYNQSSSFRPEFASRLTQLRQSSGC